MTSCAGRVNISVVIFSAFMEVGNLISWLEVLKHFGSATFILLVLPDDLAIYLAIYLAIGDLLFMQCVFVQLCI